MFALICSRHVLSTYRLAASFIKPEVNGGLVLKAIWDRGKGEEGMGRKDGG